MTISLTRVHLKLHESDKSLLYTIHIHSLSEQFDFTGKPKRSRPLKLNSFTTYAV